MVAKQNSDLGGPSKRTPTDQELLHALGHPLRRRILRALHAAGEPRSPRQLGQAFQLPVAKLSYHVRVLCDTSAIALSERRAAGGTTEYLYVSLLSDNERAIEHLASTEAGDLDS